MQRSARDVACACVGEPMNRRPPLVLAWLLGVPLLALAIWGIADNERLFFATTLNGLTLAALYFLVASGFTLVFGLMRNVNLAHGSLYLLGGYVGCDGRRRTRTRGCWRSPPASCSRRWSGLLLQIGVFRFMQGEDLRQTMVDHRACRSSLADLLLWIWGGQIYQFDPPRWIFGSTAAADRRQVSRPTAWSLLAIAIVIGVAAVVVPEPHARRHDDPRRRRRPGDAGGLGRQRAAGVRRHLRDRRRASRASPAWSAARRCRSRRARTRATCWPRWSWSSSAAWAASSGAALGAVLIGLAEQFGLAYAPTYGVVFTFVIMALVLAFRPQGILGRREHERRPLAQGHELHRAQPQLVGRAGDGRASAHGDRSRRSRPASILAGLASHRLAPRRRAGRACSSIPGSCRRSSPSRSAASR